MTLRKTNITLLIFISFTFLCLITWLIISNIVFPVPDMLNLVPNNVMGYFDVYNSGNVLSDIVKSELVRRLIQSPWWNSFKSTGLWNEVSNELGGFQQLGIDQNLIFRLIGTHSIVAFYLDSDLGQPKIKYILISELDIFTRLTMSFGQIEKFISPEYTVTKAKYNGKAIITIKSPEETYSYAFIGRAGILSNDESLIKKSLDTYRNDEDRLSAKTDFKQAKLGLPISDVSFYLNTARLLDSSKLLERYGFNPQNVSLIRDSNMMLSAVSREAGKTRLNTVLYQKNGLSKESAKSKNLPFPEDCLTLITHRPLDPKIIFKWMAKNISQTFATISDGISPTIRGSIAEAVVAPKSNSNQLLPSVLLYMQVRNRTIAETALYGLKNTLRLQDSQLKFTETTYKNAKITYSSYIPGVNFPIGIGYVFIKDDVLLLATDESSMQEVLDVLSGNARPLSSQNQYMNVMAPIGGLADEMAFINLREMSPILEQVSRLYLFQGMLTGSRSGERVATILADNSFIMGSWDYLGAVWNSENDNTDIKLVLTRK